MDLSVIPECYVDTNLIETLVPPVKRGNQKGYNHQKSCGTVASRMQKEFADEFALGIIDKDKKELDYLQQFTEIINVGSLILHRHNDPAKHHYIIQINPAVERFILDSAAAVEVSPEDFGLHSDLKKMIRISKRIKSKDDAEFKRLFKAILAAGAPSFQKLAAWVSYLKDRNYKADMQELAAL